MSSFEARLDDAALAELPFRPPHLRRWDGIATRASWEPTRIHLQSLDLFRAEARRVTAGARSKGSVSS